MSKSKTQLTPIQEKNDFDYSLEEILRQGARQMLQLYVEAEVNSFIENFKDAVDENGHRLAVRNGYHKERDILSSLGPITVKQPRVDDRKLRERYPGQEFSSAILPKYLRRTPSLDALIPALYLKGISTQDFPTALKAILGDDAKNLSSATVVRLKESWMSEYEKWSKRDLSQKKYVYIWADGIYFNVRLDDTKSCILVILAADDKGNKELLAVSDGFRESKQSWSEMLLELKSRGLEVGPSLAVGDGGLGFWAALREVYPGVAEQRCWVHKTVNILDKLPKGVQSKAKKMIHNMYLAETKKSALAAYRLFVKTFKDKYPKAVQCLEKDVDELFTFYNFPAAHWQHIRTTNPIESTFSTVRLRSKRTKGCGSREATLMMVFKLTKEAQKRWRRLRSFSLMASVLAGDKYVDGELETKMKKAA
jgi:transposase-like protein